MGREAKRALILVAGIVAAAGVLRFAGIGEKSFWMDEAGMAGRMLLPFKLMLKDVMAFDAHPPFYYVLVYGWKEAFGDGDGALRAISAVFSLATVPLIYAVGRLLFDRRVGLIGAALSGVSAFQVFFAQEARLYALTGLVAAAATYLLGRIVKGKGGLWSWIGYGITATAGIYTFYYLIFLLAAHGAGLLALSAMGRGVERARVKRMLGRWVMVMVCAAALAAPLVPGVLRRAGEAETGVQAAAGDTGVGLAEAANALRQFAHGFWVGDNAPSYMVYYGLVMLVIVGGQFAWKEGREGVVMLDAWLFLPIICVAAFPIKVHTFEAKHVLFASPALYLMAGLAATKLGRWGLALVGTLVLTNAASLWVYYQPEFQKEDWRKVAALLEKETKPGDAIYLNPRWGLYPFSRYASAEIRTRTYNNPAVAGDEFDAALLAKVASDAKRVWLVEDFSRVVGPDERTSRYLFDRLPVQERVLDEDYFMGSIRVWRLEKGEG